ncbi:4778_t:CDS:2 [Funneliformis mosseae]|uniref:4778_t:CDS:1 n=1 Tax=Funneliformis mosseae TaxID=27381 RepID=A0A9N8VA19_FUNMO|nr:4778_t:CDS:2 [Funneliformis mosseae]
MNEIYLNKKKKLQKNEAEFYDLNARPVKSLEKNLQQNLIDDNDIIRDESNIIISKH